MESSEKLPLVMPCFADRCDECATIRQQDDDGEYWACSRHADEHDEPGSDFWECREQVKRLRSALLALQAWDMLTLLADGSGAATQDAPWARKLIADALAGTQ